MIALNLFVRITQPWNMPMRFRMFNSSDLRVRTGGKMSGTTSLIGHVSPAFPFSCWSAPHQTSSRISHFHWMLFSLMMVFSSKCFLFEDFGVTLSSNVRRDAHFENVLSKAAKGVFLIRNLCRAKLRCPWLCLRKLSLRYRFYFFFQTFCNGPHFLIDKSLRFEMDIFLDLSNFRFV